MIFPRNFMERTHCNHINCVSTVTVNPCTFTLNTFFARVPQIEGSVEVEGHT